MPTKLKHCLSLWEVIVYGVGLIVAMSLINFWGIKESVRFNALATSIEAFPITSGLGVISCLLMLLPINQPIDVRGKQTCSLLVGLLIFVLAAPFYLVLGRKNTHVYP